MIITGQNFKLDNKQFIVHGKYFPWRPHEEAHDGEYYCYSEDIFNGLLLKQEQIEYFINKDNDLFD